MKVYEIISEATALTITGNDPEIANRIEALARQMGMLTKQEQIKDGLVQRYLSKMPSWLGTALKIVGFLEISRELYFKLEVLDKAFVSGQIKTKAEYEQERQYAIGYWQVQLLVPWIVKWFRRRKGLLLIIGAITGFLTVGTGIGIGAAVIAGLGGAAIDWTIATGLEVFLSSSAGQEWMRQAFTYIALFGKIGDELFDELHTMVTGTTHEQDMIDKRKKENPAADAADQPLANQTKGKLGPKAVVMNGEIVVDNDGYKVPYSGTAMSDHIHAYPNDPDVLKWKAAPSRPDDPTNKSI